MRKSSSHIDDSGLEVLVFGEEDSHEYLSAAAHVETCHICRNRLDAISGDDDIDTEARTLLAEYSLDSWAGHTTAA